MWGVQSGKTTDCGCYGGYIQPSIGQSVGLDALFAVLVAAAWFAGPRAMSPLLWEVAVVALSIIVFSGFAYWAQIFGLRNGRPFIETSPLKVGRSWKKRLLYP